MSWMFECIQRQSVEGLVRRIRCLPNNAGLLPVMKESG